MKITKRQLRSIIKETLDEGYNSMSRASKARANSIKSKFLRLYPDASVGVDSTEGWIIVNGMKAINMSQASGSPISDEEMIETMHTIYAEFNQGLGGETFEKTAADYKKHPEWFN